MENSPLEGKEKAIFLLECVDDDEIRLQSLLDDGLPTQELKFLLPIEKLDLLMEALCIACQISDHSLIAWIQWHSWICTTLGEPMDPISKSLHFQQLLEIAGMKDSVQAWAAFLTGYKDEDFEDVDTSVTWLEKSLNFATTNVLKLHANFALCMGYLVQKGGKSEERKEKELEACRSLQKIALELEDSEYVFIASLRMMQCFVERGDHAEATQMLKQLEAIADSFSLEDCFFQALVLAARASLEFNRDEAYRYHKLSKQLISAKLPSIDDPKDWWHKYLGSSGHRSYSIHRYQIIEVTLSLRIIRLVDKCWDGNEADLEEIGRLKAHLDEDEYKACLLTNAYIASLYYVDKADMITDEGIEIIERLLGKKEYDASDDQILQELSRCYFLSRKQRSAYKIFHKFFTICQMDSMTHFSSGRLSVLEQTKSLCFEAQMRLLNHPMAEISRSKQLALIWSERGRARDLNVSMGLEKRIYITDNPLKDFEEDDNMAWNEITKISYLAGEQTVFLVEAPGCECGSIFQYILHLGEVSFRRIEESTCAKHNGTRQWQAYYFDLFVRPWKSLLECCKIERIVIIQNEDEKPFISYGAFFDTDNNQYLAETYALSYAPSLLAFGRCLRREEELNLLMSDGLSAIVVGNPKTEDEQFNLPRAEEEANAITTNVKEVGYQVYQLIGEEATPKNVMRSLPSKDWVHIASHAIVNDDCPRGAIILAPENNPSSAENEASGSWTGNEFVGCNPREKETLSDMIRSLPSKHWVHLISRATIKENIANGSESEEIIESDALETAIGNDDGSGTESDEVFESMSEDDADESMDFRFPQSSIAIKHSLEQFVRNGTVSEGMLSCHDLATRITTLKARVVVLSACQTGLGKRCAEGVLGLCRSFHIAGVPTALVSLKKVDDEATCFLMKKLYKNLLKGMDIAIALQTSIKKMIRKKDDLGYEPKFKTKHWESFIVSGYPFARLLPKRIATCKTEAPQSSLLPDYMFDSLAEYQECQTLLQKLAQTTYADNNNACSLPPSMFDSFEQYQHYEILLQLAHKSKTHISQNLIYRAIKECEWVIQGSMDDESQGV